MTEATLSKSQVIREMLDGGSTVAEIAKELNTHYSFVHGVAKRHLGDDIPTKPKGVSKSALIRDMFDQGMKPAEIKKELNLDYAFVYNVLREYKRKLERNKPVQEVTTTEEVTTNE